jgi:hypothetical protein
MKVILTIFYFSFIDESENETKMIGQFFRPFSLFPFLTVYDYRFRSATMQHVGHATPKYPYP